MPARRVLSLIIALLALAGLAWCVQRLHAFGVPVLPGPLLQAAQALPNPLPRLTLSAALALREAGVLVTTLFIGLLQAGVVVLPLVVLLALWVAFRRPRRQRGRLRPVRLADRQAEPSGAAVPPSLCPACGLSVRDDWRACPRCGQGLPAARAS